MLVYSGHCEIVGGDAKYLLDLVNSIDLNGAEISIVTDVNPSFERFVVQNLKAPVSVSYIPTRPVLFHQSRRTQWGRYGRGLCNALFFSRLRDCLWNFFLFYKLFRKSGAKVDIFHFNNGGYPAKEAGLMAIVAAGLLGKKTIMSFHNMPVKRSLLRPSDYVFDYLVSRYCHCVIAASDALKEAIVRERKINPRKVHTIYCGLPDQVPLSQSDCLVLRNGLGVAATAPVLIICGNLDEDRKGHLPLFKALALIRSEFPNVVLLVVGHGGSTRLQHLKSVVQGLGLDDAVKFLGYRRDIHELNCVADLAVVPSIVTEATPYTIKEAARAGRPVVTTSVGGCSEAVEIGKTGYVVPPDDVDALANAISELLRNRMQRETMGRQARELFLQKFLLSEKVKQHEAIYTALRSLQ